MLQIINYLTNLVLYKYFRLHAGKEVDWEFAAVFFSMSGGAPLQLIMPQFLR